MKWSFVFVSYIIGIFALILNIALYIGGAAMVVIAVCKGSVTLGICGGVAIVGGAVLTAAVLATVEM